MRDPVSIKKVAALHPKYIPYITGLIDDVEAGTGLIWRVAQGLRTFQEQADIYAQGRTKPGPIVTYSPPGASYHNYGLAVDMVPFIKGSLELNWKYDYRLLRQYVGKWGIQMGLDFPHPDSDHFENKFGKNWRDFLHQYTVKDFIAGTTFVNIS